jgi:hypothetical protein
MSWTPITNLAKAVDKAGFEYDPEQDIVQSKMDVWQRNFGYCWLYDALAPLGSMIIDCEPFYFDYDGKRWMIELWKGQYGLATGAEIGLYNHEMGLIEDRAGLFWCVTNRERLTMDFALYRDGARLFKRGPEWHWWLTGFKWGVFSDPSSLKMEVHIDGFPTRKMRDSFADSVYKKSYLPSLGTRDIRFWFDIPKTPQPPTRIVAPAVQTYNEWLVKIYEACTTALDFNGNDPNNFTNQEATHAVKLAAEKARSTMPAQVDPVTAYHIILDLYEKWAQAWHGRK